MNNVKEKDKAPKTEKLKKKGSSLKKAVFCLVCIVDRIVAN